MAFALDLNASCGSSGAPRISYNWELWPFKILLTKARQSDVTEFHGKSDIPKDFENIFHICTVGLWSPSSALQVGMVKNVKFDHDFATFFGMILLKYYIVPCPLRTFVKWHNVLFNLKKDKTKVSLFRLF